MNNAAVDPGAILNTFINADAENRLGAELTLSQKITEHFDITPSVDLQYMQVKVNNDKLNLSNEGFTFEGKLILNYRVAAKSPLFDKLNFQVTGEYESPEVEPQGKNKEQYVVDFGFRKDFLKNNKATLTFNINDVFNTRRFGSIYDTENFYQDSYRRWNVRSFRVSLSYRFGKANFQLFKRNGNKEEENGNGNGGGEGREGSK